MNGWACDTCGYINTLEVWFVWISTLFCNNFIFSVFCTRFTNSWFRGVCWRDIINFPFAFCKVKVWWSALCQVSEVFMQWCLSICIEMVASLIYSPGSSNSLCLLFHQGGTFLFFYVLFSSFFVFPFLWWRSALGSEFRFVRGWMSRKPQRGWAAFETLCFLAVWVSQVVQESSFQRHDL